MSLLLRIYHQVIPADPALRLRRLELLVWSFLLAISFNYPWSGFLAWLSLVRPILIIASLKPKAAFKAAYFHAFFFNLFSLYWIAHVTPGGMIAVILIVASYYALVWSIFNRVHRFKPILGFVLLPILWTGMEHFRTLSEFAFPWSDLGYSQSYYIYLLQIVSVISVHGLSILIVIVNVLLCQLFRPAVSPERKVTSLFSAIAIVLGLVAYGWIELPPNPIAGDYKVALLQGSLPLEVKWARGNKEQSFQLYDSLSSSIADSSIKLYVWPETSAPTYLTHDHEGRSRVGEISRRTGGYHLVGALAASGVGDKQKHFNSCFQFNPDGTIDARHDKVKLVPFSEHVPYQDYLPFLQRSVLQDYMTFIKTYDIQWWSDFYPGDSLPLFQLPDAAYTTMICFEIAFPEFVRQTILEGAEFIVGITNDTWFGSSPGVYQHSRIFVTRAVENRCWGVRVANSGLSYIVDDYGRFRDEIGLYEVAAITGSVRRLDSYSIFTRWGDLAGKWSFLITLLIVGILLTKWIMGKLSNLVRRSQP